MRMYGPLGSRLYVRAADAAGYVGFYRALLRAAGPLEGRVLDAGCGHGPLALAAHREYGNGIELHGFDSSRPMLELAAERMKARNVPFRLYRADARDLADARTFPDGRPSQFADGSFDAVLSAGMLEYAGPAAAAELRRVLKPGGRVVLCTIRDNVLGRMSGRLWRFRIVRTAELERTLGAKLTEIPVPSPNLYLRTLKQALVLEGKDS